VRKSSKFIDCGWRRNRFWLEGFRLVGLLIVLGLVLRLTLDRLIGRIMFSNTRRAAMLAKRVSHDSFRPVLQRPLSTHARKERQADTVLCCVAAIGVVAIASYPSRAELEELGHPVPKRIVTQASEAIGSATKADESLLIRVSMSSYAVMYPSSLRSTRVAMHISLMII
jgi:hypothetical protein